jgi:hypothetical protein
LGAHPGNPSFYDDIKSSTRELVARDADFVVAGAAIDGAIILGQEWDLRLDTALGTNDRVHLAWGAFARTPATGRAAPRRAAGWTTTRLIHQTFLLVKLLFTRGEYEIVSALTAIKGFVFEVQLGTSL